MKSTFLSGSLSLLLMGFVFYACSANKVLPATSPEEVGRLLENKTFVFVPTNVFPTGGRTRQLTSEFFFRVSPDTIQSYLPYMGRSFTAPMDPSRGGMDFTTTDFGYQASKGNKEATNITIEPRTGSDVRQITMQIFPNGSASLQATFNNRQPISYNGYLQARR